MIDDRDLDGIEDKFDSTFNTPEELLEKRVSSELSLLKLMRICSKGLHRPIYRSLLRKTLTATKLCVTKEMKKELRRQWLTVPNK